MKNAKLILTALTLTIAGAAFAPGSAKALRPQQGGSEDGSGPTRIGNSLFVQEDRIEGLKGINELCTKHIENFINAVYYRNLALSRNISKVPVQADEIALGKEIVQKFTDLCMATVKEADEKDVDRSATSRALIQMFWDVGYDVSYRQGRINNFNLASFANFDVSFSKMRRMLGLPTQDQAQGSEHVSGTSVR